MVNRQEFANYVSAGEVAYTDGKAAQAWGYIRARPGTFLKLSARRAYRFWAGTGNVDAPAVYEIHALLTTLLGGSGLILLWGMRRQGLAVLMGLPLLLFPLPYYVTHAEFRYRLDIDAILTILAAYAATEMVTAWTRRRLRCEAAISTNASLIGPIAR
jgi:hypothetical protein